MEKLKLKVAKIDGASELSREQMKGVLGGVTVLTSDTGSYKRGECAYTGIKWYYVEGVSLSRCQQDGIANCPGGDWMCWEW